MNAAQWWALFDAHQQEMRDLVERYHPTSGNRHEMPISAAGAEVACEVARNQILRESRVPGTVAFDAAVKARDARALATLLNGAWFGMPESTSVRYEPGFYELCDLCEGADEEDDANASFS